LFVIIFCIGVGALALAAITNDLLEYYQNKSAIETAKQHSEKLRSLNDDYDSLLKQMEDDPDMLKRLEAVSLGVEDNDSETVYPRIKPEDLAAVKKVLMEGKSAELEKGEIPKWLERCSEPVKRATLFVAGAVLVLISFVCFNAKGILVKKE